MDTKLKNKDDLWKDFRSHLYGDMVEIGCQAIPMTDVEGVFKWFCKKVQRNAIEVAVQRCNEDAEADYIDRYGEYVEAFVINSSILDCKQKLFEENDLI